jgi:putative ABC transport system permease protein
VETLLQDIRYSARTLLKTKGFAAAATLALALGIGANSAIFSVVNAVLLRPLPYANSDRLVLISETNMQPQAMSDQLPVAPANFVDWREQQSSFESMGACANNIFNLTGTGEPERIMGMFATAGMFDTLGVRPLVGRVFSNEEEEPGNGRVVVLSHSLWQRRFNAEASAIEKAITLNNEPYTIIGVMPEGFRSVSRISGGAALADSELWLPFSSTSRAAEFMRNRTTHLLAVIARLKPAVTREQAEADLAAIASRLEQAYPESNSGFGINITPMHEQIVGKTRPMLLVLLGAVAFVLLIACANVANLLLARAAARQKEIAIRTALGASRGRLVRQLLTESLLLSLAGGTAGILLALWGVDLLRGLAPRDLPRLSEVRLDLGVIGFTLMISILTGLVFGFAPAFGASKPDLNETLKEGSRGSTRSFGGRSSLRSMLVVSEVALALVLSIGAGLMIRSFLRLQQVNPGFNAANVATLELALPPNKYQKAEHQKAFFQEVIRRVENLPGVQSAGITNAVPLSRGDRSAGFTIDGRPDPAQGEGPSASVRTISADYFKAMGIPLLAGRFFTEADRTGAPDVTIINEALARRYFPNADALGKRILSTRLQLLGGEPVTREIVGIVGDVRHFGLDIEPRAEMYLPYNQDAWPGMNLMVRASTDPTALVAAVRNEIWAVDKDQPIYNVKSMEQRVAESTSQRRFNMLLLVVFAFVALMLAAVGVYGVMSYSVTQRTHELGIRQALGAQAADVVRLVVGQAIALAGAGVALGLAASFALTRLMSGLLYGVSATDPLTFAVIPLVLIGVALVASFVPARRATKVDPMIALRHE